MVAYTNPQHRKKEESQQLRGEREIRSSLWYTSSSQNWQKYHIALQVQGKSLGGA